MGKTWNPGKSVPQKNLSYFVETRMSYYTNIKESVLKMRVILNTLQKLVLDILQ